MNFAMFSHVPRNLFFDTAESDDFLDVLTSSYIRRNGQKQVVFCHTIVFIDNLLRGISKSMILDSTPVFCRLVIIQSFPSKEV